MLIEKFVKNGIHYIRETGDNGSINIYTDPDFYTPAVEPLLPAPDLNTLGKQLSFIIKRLKLLDGYQP